MTLLEQMQADSAHIIGEWGSNYHVWAKTTTDAYDAATWAKRTQVGGLDYLQCWIEPASSHDLMAAGATAIFTFTAHCPHNIVAKLGDRITANGTTLGARNYYEVVQAIDAGDWVKLQLKWCGQ